ncbi:MAG TPA: hypothetical protein VFX03_12885 [Thermomicrobiales bacterium]|nr:hypothetical protein [Thermomicrobiales bacterium]
MIAALAAALVVTVGSANGVGAERPPSGGDSHQQACRALYDRTEQLRNEYKDVASTNPGSNRLDEILTELRNLGSDWKSLHCDDRYGSIAAPARVPGGPWQVDLDGGNVFQPLEPASPASDAPTGELSEIDENPPLAVSGATETASEPAPTAEPSMAPVADSDPPPAEDAGAGPTAEATDVAPADEAIDADAAVTDTAAADEPLAELAEGQE